MDGRADVALRICCRCTGRDGGMDFGILGPLEVRDGPVPVRVPGVKERALLTDLLIHAGRVVSADRLVEDLWGADPPGRPANTLQGRVSALRRALGPAAGLLVTTPPGYRLAVDADQVDAGRFERLLAQAHGDPRVLTDAVRLWRGPALAEFADQPWARAEAARLEELLLAAQETLIEADLAAGRTDGVVARAEALVAAHPTRERPRELLMRALYRAGRQAEALTAYQRIRAVLAEDLGVDPSPPLQRLHRRMLRQDPALDGTAAHNLPVRSTSFLGRDEQLRELASLVPEHRLVTLTGPGGAGKTSLAVELARRLVPGYPDGVRLVELAPLRDPAPVAEAVLAALAPAEPDTGSQPAAERLAGFLRDKTLLLVLDNCEHLVDACAALVRRLLRAGPAVTVLTTSREVLGVPGEVVRPVPPLPVTDAAALFAERAGAADPSFRLDPGTAEAVSEVCRRLDGLPLAIELAAARVRALPPGEIAARLDDRFRVLAGGRPTLLATMDWSWDLLTGDERRLLRRLAVFAGGWTLDAAEAVCGDALPGLLRLVDQSLVEAVGGEPARFRMLETVRAYAARRLAEAGETGAVAARHRDWFTGLAERAAAHRTAAAGMRLLDADHDNIRAVLDREPAVRLAGSLGFYWSARHSVEGRRRLTAVLPSGDARVLQAAALVDVALTPTEETAALAHRSAVLFEERGEPGAAALSYALAAAARVQLHGPSRDVGRQLDEAHVGLVAAGDRWGQAFTDLLRVGVLLYHDGRPDAAAEAGERALAVFRELDDPAGASQAWFGLAAVAEAAGDLAAAARRYAEARTAAGAYGPLWVRLAALVRLGGVAAAQGDRDRAAALHAEAAALARRTGQRRAAAHVRNEQGAAARMAGDLERARALHTEALVVVRELLGWSIPHTLAQLACAEARRGATGDATAHLREAAGLLLATPQPATAAAVLVGAALVAAGDGDPVRAARLLAVAEATYRAAGVAPVGVEAYEMALVREAVGVRPVDAGGLTAEAVLRTLTDG